MTGLLRHMPAPCGETKRWGPCPFRVDAPAGEFTAERYEQLADTAGLPGAEAPVGAPMFACHHVSDTEDGTPQPIACAGWLAVSGSYHLGVRLAVAEHRLDLAALTAPEGVELFDSYDEMATQQANGLYDPDRAAAARDRAGHNLPLIKKWISGLCELRDADVGDTERGHAGRDTIREGIR